MTLSDASSQRRLPNNAAISETVACPSCGKPSIVRRSPNIFDCLNCNFHKEFPPLISASALLEQSNSLTEQISDRDRAQRFLAEREQHPISVSAESNRRRIDARHRSEKTDLFHPLFFAAIAVIIGILIF